MRLVSCFALSTLALSACTIADDSLRNVRGSGPGYTLEAPPANGFLRMADTGNPGLGVVPIVRQFDDTLVPGAWASMGDRLCAIDGTSGGVREDVFLDEDTQPNSVTMHDELGDIFLIQTDYMLEAIDVTGQGTSYPALGEVVDARLRPDRAIVTLSTTWEGCSIVERDAGDRTMYPLGLESCTTGVVQLDDSGDAPRIWTIADEQLFLLEDGEVAHLGQAIDLSVDPRSGSRALQIDAHTVELTTSRAEHTLSYAEPIVDVAVRGGHLVVLTADAMLHLASTITGQELAAIEYYGDIDETTVELTRDGQALVAVSRYDMAFYALYSALL
jgi:hypothetical protein